MTRRSAAQPAPEIDDRLVVLKDADRRADLAAFGEVALENFADEADGVPLPRRSGRPIAQPAPEIDDRLAVEIDADRRADLAALGEVALEDLADKTEARQARTLDRHGGLYICAASPMRR